MGIDAEHISRPSHSLPGWLTENVIKRGALLYWTALLTMSAAIIHLIGALKQPPQSVLLVILLFGFTIIQAVTAVAVVVFPVRRLLIAAAVVEVIGGLAWIIAHTTGLPDGLTMWHPETLNLPDLYLPALEAVSAFFFLCLTARSWSTTSRVWRMTVAALPYLLLLGILIWMALNFNTAQLFLVIFILDSGLPVSLQDFFLPIAGLLVLFLLLWLILPRLRVRMPRAWRTVLVLLPALLIVNIITWTGGIDAATTAWFPASAPVRAAAGQTTTLEYCLSSGGSPLAMDLSEPSAQAARPAPVVFYIHGGEGLQGSRSLEDGSLDGVYFTRFRDDMVNHGFAVGAIDYGLFPQYKIVEEIEDAKCAVRFLRAYASDLGIDPQRIGVYGVSMGGYLSSMLGTVGPQAGFDVGQYLNQSSRVEAVIDMWGPSDLTNWSGSPSWVSSIGKGLSGGAKKGSVKSTSPVNYVAPGDPPFLILHGTDDWFIAPRHSQELAKLLHAAGVPVTLVMIQHDQHGLAVPTPGQVEQPAPATLIQMMRDFFVKTLAS